MKKALPILFLAICTACTSVPVPVLVDIPAGSFMMGSENPPMPEWDEAPVHEVSLPAFRMSATEITNAQYEAFDPAHKEFRGYGQLELMMQKTPDRIIDKMFMQIVKPPVGPEQNDP